MMDLLEYNVGNGLCHSWYVRRFLQPVKVTETQYPHSGLGLSCYVQWTSPIRRFTDFQVHLSVKRFIRRKMAYQLMKEGRSLPSEVTDRDLGLPPGTIKNEKLPEEGSVSVEDLDSDLNFMEGLGLMGAARALQRQSEQYWMFEYIRRLVTAQPNRVFSAIVLGCIDPERRQYAIYIGELGLEHKYINPAGRLGAGVTLQLRVDNVVPKNGILYFVQVV